MSKYPNLEESALTALLSIKQQFNADDKFIDDSPYAPEVKAMLSTILEVRTETVVLRDSGAVDTKQRGRKTNKGLSEEQWTLVEKEATELLKELKDLKPPAGKGFDHDTKIQIIKAKTSLIEKVVNIQERTFNVRKVSNFQKIVLDILAELIPADMIDEFQRRIKEYC